MNKNVKIVLTGGGSVNWSPKIINDLTLTSGLENAHYVIHDIDVEAGIKIVKLGKKLSEKRELNCKFSFTDSQKDAYKDADFVLITISTGGLDAMEYDLKIPEDYRIYQTVGDTVGPGGWARALRNIPVFKKIANSIEKYSPDAIVLNYTNPMSVLTDVFYKVSNLKTVGLCHGLFEVYATLMKIFGLDSEKDIKVRFGGTNHFFWILDMKIKGEDGYEMLKRKMNGRTFADVVTDVYTDGAGFHSNKYVTSELFDYYGYLPYVADRHICEFFPYYLAEDEKRFKKYNIERTYIEDRIQKKEDRKNLLEKNKRGEEELSEERSRETAADIISSFVNGKEFIDVVNLPNEGQISNLPKDSIVETMGVINDVGFTPIMTGDLPEPILNMVLPHVNNQNILIEAGLEGDFDKALWALCNDPLCSHISLPEIKEMAGRLLKINRQYLPQFPVDTFI